MCSKKRDIDCRELLFITWGGMIRGAIAFGLVLKIPDGEKTENINGKDVSVPIFKERGAIVTTTLALVIITTLFFGTFMPVV